MVLSYHGSNYYAANYYNNRFYYPRAVALAQPASTIIGPGGGPRTEIVVEDRYDIEARLDDQDLLDIVSIYLSSLK